MHISRRQTLAITSFIAALTLLAPLSSASAADMPKVSFDTTMGEIVLELNPTLAPKSVENFLAHVKAGHYKGIIFHRVINGFMIQTGGMDKAMNEKPRLRPPIQNEAANGLKNDTYTVAMARTGDPHSASAQFFINVNNNDMLNYPSRDGWGYAVFGKVVQGMDVVDRIKLVEVTNRGPHANVPVNPVIINSASLLK